MNASQTFRNKLTSPIGLINNLFFSNFIDNSNMTPLKKYILEMKTGKTPSKQINKYFINGDINWFKPSDIGFGIHLTEAKDKLTNETFIDKKATIFTKDTLLVTCIGDIGRVGVLKNTSSSNQQITGITFNEKILPEFAYYIFLFEKENLANQASSTTIPIINQSHLEKLKVSIPPIKVQKDYLSFMEYCEKCLIEGLVPVSREFNLSSTLINKAQLIFEVFYKTKRLSTINEVNTTLLMNLRKKILDDAVQGKLVSQSENDEPASIFLKRIRENKEQLLKEKKVKKEKKLPPILDIEKCFELPHGWEWTRLGEVIDLISGQHIEKSYYNENEIGVPYLTGPSDFGEKYTSTSKWTNKPKVMAKKNSILITVKGSGVGKINILTEDAAISRQLMAISPILIHYDYLILILKTNKSKLQDLKIGIAIPGIGRENILNLVVALPPLCEQKRIVKKIEQLMDFCNKLEQTIKHTEQQSKKLMKAILQEAFKVKEEVLG